MNQKTKTHDSVTLDLETLLELVDELELPVDSGNTEYTTRSMLKLYLYRLIKRIKGFKALAKQLQLKANLLTLFGVSRCPHRTTLSRRFKLLPLALREQIRSLHAEFVTEGVTLVDAMSIDASLMHAKGNVWHKKQRDKGELPSCGNIDTDAHWGKSGCGTWVYGYRVHCLVSGCSDAALACDVEVASANKLPGCSKTISLLLSPKKHTSCWGTLASMTRVAMSCVTSKLSALSPLSSPSPTPPKNVLSELHFTTTPRCVKPSHLGKQPSSLFREGLKLYSNSNIFA